MRFRFPNIRMRIKNMKGERFGMNDSNMVLINRKQLYDEIWKISVAGLPKSIIYIMQN